MKGARRSIVIVFSLSTVVLLSFLPFFLCRRPVIHAAFAFVTHHDVGALEVQSCSLGWWQGLSCEGVRYQNPAWGVQVTVPKLAGDKGLFVLLVAPRYLGKITLDQPTLTVLPHPEGTGKTLHNSVVMVSPGQRIPEAAIEIPWWEQLTFRLKVNKGRVVFDQGQGSSQELARDMELTGSLAVGTLNYSLAFRSGLEQQGQLRAEGFINLPAARQSLLEALVSRAEVDVKGVEIAAFLELAASRGNFPRGKGVLNATCHVATSGIDDLELQGETDLRGVHLSGGFLGEDTPAIDHLLFTFKGSHKGNEGWRLAALHLESDPVRIEAKGSYDRSLASLVAKGSLNLPVVATQLPHLLSLQEKTTFREGVADFALNISGTPQNLVVKADCRTGHFSVVRNGQLFSWETPLTLVAAADRIQGKTMVRTLQVHAPFLDVQGNGGADDFTLRATADLGGMFEELDKIFALNVHGKGELELTGSSRQEKDGRYRLDARVGISDFSLSQGGVAVLPSHDFLLTGEAWTLPSFDLQGLTSLRINGDAWPGKLSFSARKGEQKSEEQSGSCAISGDINLARLNSVIRGLTGVAPACKLGGNFSFAGSGAWMENRLSLEALQGKIDQLTVKGAGYAYQEPRVVVSLANNAVAGINPVGVRELMVAEDWQDFLHKEQPLLLVDWQQQRLDLRHLTLEAPGATTRGSLSVGNWWQPHRDFAAEVNATSNSALLTVFLKAAGWFPENMAIQGRAQTGLQVRSRGEQQVLTDLTVEMEPFELLLGSKKIYRDNRFFLKTTLLSGGGGDGEVAIPAFALQTTPLHAEGTGLVQRNVPASLELQGTLTPNLSYFTDLFATHTGQKVALAGKLPGVFMFSCPLQLPVDWNQLSLVARLPVDMLQYHGIALRQFEMPVEAKQGRLRVDIAGELNSGTVALQPQWDFGSSRGAVHLPAATQILQNVALEQPLDGVLGRMHPLFGSLARPEGAIDLRLDSFSWPLHAKGVQWPVFKATINLDRVRFNAAKALQDLLDLGGFEQKAPLQCKERALTCEGRAGHITCSPLHLLAGAAEIEILGSVGMDGTLDYHLQVPVTELLAAKVHLPLQQGASVRAEMSGTLDSPSFSPKAFLGRVTDQLGKTIAEKPGETLAQPVSEKPSAAGP